MYSPRLLPFLLTPILLAGATLPAPAQEAGRLPDTRGVMLRENVVYQGSGPQALMADFYYPAGHRDERPMAAVVYFNAGDAPGARLKESARYIDLGKLSAASGVVAVTFDARRGRAEADFGGLLAFIRSHSRELGVDGDRIFLMACGENAAGALAAARANHPFVVGVATHERDLGPEDPARLAAALAFVRSSLQDGKRAATIGLGESGGRGGAFSSVNSREAIDARFQSGDFVGAADLYSRYLLQHPDDGVALFNLGFASLQQGQYEKGLECFKRCVELGERPGPATYNVACSYALMNRKDEAFQWLDRAFASSFDDTELFLQDPDLSNLRSDPRYARLRARLTGEPVPAESQPATLEEAEAFFAAERWSDAVQAYRSYLERNPDDANARFRLGFSAIRAGQHEQGIATFKQCVERGIAPVASSYNVACSLALLQRKDEAFEWLDRALEAGFNDRQLFAEDPDLASLRSDPRYARLLARVGAQGSRGVPAAPPAPAVPARPATPAPRANPPVPARPGESVGELMTRGQTAVQAGEWAKALEAYTRVTELQPQNGGAWFQRGYACIPLGRHDQGIESFKKALALDFQRASTAYNIACCYALKGDKDKGFLWLDVAVKSGFNNWQLLRTDKDIDNLRGDPRFSEYGEEF